MQLWPFAFSSWFVAIDARGGASKRPEYAQNPELPDHPDRLMPDLIDDIRYTPKDAEYYRMLGVDVWDEHITEEDFPDDGTLTPRAVKVSKKWDNMPFTDENGEKRYLINYGFFDSNGMVMLDGDVQFRVRKFRTPKCLNF